ncbi:MAG TPA: 1-acyl-sn-glycerol-3-phosphate acyltransferase [Ruminococcaceae bacterium]|nr:1-acyl-sn-glycerol-3-phosphate acyltransferase [Oscillospiraceae bacterium]
MWFYSLARIITRCLIYILYDIKFEGLENIPDNGGYILASNHRTNFDPIFLAVKLKPQLFFMAKAELFKNKFVGFIIKNLGAFPVERGKGDTGAIEWAVNLLKDGKVLAMFPEGTRSLDGVPLKPKSGVAVVANQTKADILPCAVCFGKRLGFRGKVTIKYGKLIKNQELQFKDGNPGEIKNASKIIMNKIIELLGI